MSDIGPRNEQLEQQCEALFGSRSATPRLWTEFDYLADLRMDQGQKTYGDATFNLPVDKQIKELQDELLDARNYAKMAWCKLERLRRAMAANPLERDL